MIFISKLCLLIGFQEGIILFLKLEMFLFFISVAYNTGIIPISLSVLKSQSLYLVQWCRRRIRAFDRAIMVNGTIVIACPLS